MFVEQKNLESSTIMIESQRLSDEGENFESSCQSSNKSHKGSLKGTEKGDYFERMEQNECESQKDKKIKQFNRWMVEWSADEDQVLFEKYMEIGSKWVQLSKIFVNKSDNAVKNRFYCCMRKVQRKMHLVQKQKIYKQNKPIGYESLLTVLELGKCQTEINDRRFVKIRESQNSIMELRQLIIHIAKQPEDDIKDLSVMTLIDKYLQLKHSLKFINIQRVKKNVRKSTSQVVSLAKKNGEVQTIPSRPVNVLEFQVLHKQELQLKENLCKEVLEEIVDIPEFINSKRKSSLQLNSQQDLDALGLESQRFDDLFFI